VNAPDRAARLAGAPRAALAALLAAALLPLPAAATLGEGLASVQADTLRAAAVRRVHSEPAGPVHTLTLPDGSVIRQYLTADGRVYAVSWHTRFKPRLDQLLGAHFDTYVAAGRQAQQQRGGVRHAARLSRGDLVVEASAHLQAHVGRAFLRSLLPAGAGPDAIR
jgi:hypothetical protein